MTDFGLRGALTCKYDVQAPKTISKERSRPGRPELNLAHG
jgi:hypothetical protein